MDNMVKKVNEFCEKSDKLMVDVMKMILGMEDVTLEDVMSGVTLITPEQFMMFQKCLELYMLAKEITIGQYEMMDDMNKKLDKLLELK